MEQDTSGRTVRILLVTCCIIATVLTGALAPGIGADGITGSPIDRALPGEAFPEATGTTAADKFGAGSTGLGALTPGANTGVGGDLGLNNQTFASQETTTHFIVESSQPAYWRTGTYASYTGSGWQRDTETDPSDGEVKYGRDITRGERIIYSVQLKRAARSVPTAWRPKTISGLDNLGVTDAQAIQPSAPLEPGTTYEGVSYAPPRDPSILRASDQSYPRNIRQQYTQLPADTPTRIRELTARITPSDSGPYQTAISTQRWLRNNKQYSLSASTRSDQIADTFIFEMETGYCEYFATAMTVMLRSQDIPARYVVGYSTGDQVDPNTYKVRGMNAHAWVEVYFENIGWVRFDPTPGGERLAAQQQQLSEAGTQYNPADQGSPGESFEAGEINRDAALQETIEQVDRAQQDSPTPANNNSQSAGGRSGDVGSDGNDGTGGTEESNNNSPRDGGGTGDTESDAGNGSSTGGDQTGTNSGGSDGTGDTAGSNGGSTGDTNTGRGGDGNQDGDRSGSQNGGDSSASNGDGSDSNSGESETGAGDSAAEDDSEQNNGGDRSNSNTEQSDDEDDEPPAYEISLDQEQPIPGESVNVTVTRGGDPVSDVTVLFNGESIGKTDQQGRVTGAIPFAEELRVSIQRPERARSLSGLPTVAGGGKRISGVVASGRHTVASAPLTSTAAGAQQNNTYSINTNASVSIIGEALPGENVIVVATVNNAVISQAEVTIDGTVVGETGQDGRANVTLPNDAGQVAINITRKAVSGSTTVAIPPLSIAVATGAVALPFSSATVTATYDDRPAVGVPVFVDGEQVATTGPDGTATVQLSAQRSTIAVEARELRAETTVTGLLRNLAIIVAVSAGVVAGLFLTGYYFGYRPRQMLQLIPYLFRRGIQSGQWLLIMTVRYTGVAGNRVLKQMTSALADLRALIRMDVTVGALWTQFRTWVRAQYVRVAAIFTQHTDRETTADESDKRTEEIIAIREAWARFLRCLSLSRRQMMTSTPDELATYAVEHDGLPERAVTRLRDAFRGVEYGSHDAETRLQRVQNAIEEIERGLQEDDQTAETTPTDGGVE